MISPSLEPEERERLATEHIKFLYKLATLQRDDPIFNTLALERLFRLSFGADEVLAKYGIASHAKEFCRDHLESALAKVVMSSHGFTLFCGVVHGFDWKLVDMDSEVDAKRRAANKALVQLVSTTGEHCEALQALAVLYALGIFQLYGGDPDAVTALTELDEFRMRFENKRDDETTSAYLVETLLSLTARPSPLVRQASKHVFGHFAPYLSWEALKLLAEPLSAPESLEGHKKLFLNEDEMDDISGSDVESEIGDLDTSEDGAEDDESDLSASEQEADEAAGEDPQQKAFEDDLAKLLKTQRPDQEDDSDSDAGSDMTDTEMIAIDGQISAAFKGRKASLPPSRRDQKSAKEAVIHFKGRILDLIAAYLECGVKRKDDALRPLAKRSVGDALQLMPDLVRLAATTTSKALGTRVGGIVFGYKKEFKNERNQWVKEMEGDDGSEKKARVFAALQQMHDELGSQDSQVFARTASTACLTLAAALRAANMLGEVKELYEATKNEKGGRVQRAFFEGWNNWCQSQKV
jgi:DNA polymerase phi